MTCFFSLSVFSFDEGKFVILMQIIQLFSLLWLGLSVSSETLSWDPKGSFPCHVINYFWWFFPIELIFFCAGCEVANLISSFSMVISNYISLINWMVIHLFLDFPQCQHFLSIECPYAWVWFRRFFFICQFLSSCTWSLSL